jgi:hypothetical protein
MCREQHIISNALIKCLAPSPGQPPRSLLPVKLLSRNYRLSILTVTGRVVDRTAAVGSAN